MLPTQNKQVEKYRKHVFDLEKKAAEREREQIRWLLLSPRPVAACNRWTPVQEGRQQNRAQQFHWIDETDIRVEKANGTIIYGVEWLGWSDSQEGILEIWMNPLGVFSWLPIWVCTVRPGKNIFQWKKNY